jgi:hypothetical protein
MPQGTYTATVGSETTVFETDVTTPATFYAEIGLANLQPDEAITFYLYKKVTGRTICSRIAFLSKIR